MKSAEWNERYNIGVESVDKAHRRLFSIVRKISTLTEDEEKNKWSCMEGIKYLKGYSVKHFAEEEAYMKSIQYQDYELHRRLHENMKGRMLPCLEMELVKSNYSNESVHFFVNFCIGWLKEHILIADRAITGKTKNKWVYPQKEEEMSELEEAVNHILEKDFRLESRLASKYYSGEEIGNSVCYRMLFQTRGGKKQQICLLFDERLSVFLAVKTLHESFSKLDKGVINAVEPLSKQIAKRLDEQVACLDFYKLEKENVLTYAQLIMTFERAYPRYSMLFSTSAGFLAVCVQ